jgi:hypothetical protein
MDRLENFILENFKIDQNCSGLCFKVRKRTLTITLIDTRPYYGISSA